MAVPPTYADLGKFAKGYGFGLIKLDLKTKSENGLEFTTSGSANTETTKVTGSLETEFCRNRGGKAPKRAGNSFIWPCNHTQYLYFIYLFLCGAEN
uniref:Voltage-dependent anion-selective channel protein 1 n=1 Tax=Marmota marmota marmota TaxID=9994 RepID=A0A8C5ZSK1_MARMA